MQLSLHSDFACRVLIYLATNNAQKSSIEEIARAFHISENHLIKVVHRLGKFGFIETTRGRGGGIRLARAPQQISIGDVIRKTETNMNIVECFDLGTNTCPIIGACGLKAWLHKATEAFLATLDQVTLADISSNDKKLAGLLEIKVEKVGHTTKPK